MNQVLTDGSNVSIDQLLRDYRAAPFKEAMPVIAEDVLRAYYADGSLIASSIHLADGPSTELASYIKAERGVVLFQSSAGLELETSRAHCAVARTDFITGSTRSRSSRRVSQAAISAGDIRASIRRHC